MNPGLRLTTALFLLICLAPQSASGGQIGGQIPILPTMPLISTGLLSGIPEMQVRTVERIVLKFTEGTAVRWRDGWFVDLAGRDLSRVNSAIDLLMRRPDEVILAEKRRLDVRSEWPLADFRNRDKTI